MAGENTIDFLDSISSLLEKSGVQNYDLCFAGDKACITFPCQDITVCDRWNKSFSVLASLASSVCFRAVKRVKDCMVVELQFPVEVRYEQEKKGKAV